MSHLIRLATEADLAAIMELEKASFGNDSWSRPTMRAELMAPHTYYLVAHQDEKILGYAGLSKVASSSSADVQTIAVSDSHRRTGIGRQLMQALIEQAAKLTATEMYLEVREDKPAPQKLYDQLGFERIDRRENYYQPDGVAAIVMRLTISTDVKSEPVVLGIETSCDETGIGIVRGTTLLANVISSSMDQHARFGGVVPEIAARAHLEALEATLQKALETAGISIKEIDAVAVVDILERGKLETPTVALLVSGGHTSLLLVRDLLNDVELLGETIDDAAGEAFDKIARVLGLSYPGGPEIDKAAQNGDAKAIRFPRGLTLPKDQEKHRYNFSFSGLKTAVARHVELAESKGETVSIADVAANNVPRLILGGGVVANSRLREVAKARCQEAGIELRIPALSLCTDNGAMIASLGAQKILAGEAPSKLDFGVYSTLPV